MIGFSSLYVFQITSLYLCGVPEEMCTAQTLSTYVFLCFTLKIIGTGSGDDIRRKKLCLCVYLHIALQCYEFFTK